MEDQEYCLKWKTHQPTLTNIFHKLLEANLLIDCTISAGGQNVPAHKILLTACSPFFERLLSGIKGDHHAVIVLSNVTSTELRALMDYMYCGEVNISPSHLGGLLKVAEALQIHGLYEPGESPTFVPPPPAPTPSPVAPSPSELTVEQSRQPTPNVALDCPEGVSQDNAVRSPVPKRRKRAKDIPLPSEDPLTKSDPAPLAPTPLPSEDDAPPDNVPLPDPPEPEREPETGTQQEFQDTESVTLDDDEDDDRNDDMDQSQQPESPYTNDGSSQDSWKENSNDECFVAVPQAVRGGMAALGAAVEKSV